MYTRVCGIFRQNFEMKKALRSSCMFLGLRSHGPTGLKIGSLWIHLPVWRELKLNPKNVQIHHLRQLWIHLPVWRELKLIIWFVCFATVFTLDTPSRLKGIETKLQITQITLFYKLWIHLPVWRELKRLHCEVFLDHSHGFGYTFPFEGNWNVCVLPLEKFSVWSLDTPSRLKGIETITVSVNAMASKSALDTPSRLKGIETVAVPVRDTPYGFYFGYTFPFEGNWNPREMSKKIVSWGYALDTPSRLKGIETRSVLPVPDMFPLWIHLPVWRELKLGTLLRENRRLPFGYTFPFEGNWNPIEHFRGLRDFV